MTMTRIEKLAELSQELSAARTALQNARDLTKPNELDLAIQYNVLHGLIETVQSLGQQARDRRIELEREEIVNQQLNQQ